MACGPCSPIRPRLAAIRVVGVGLVVAILVDQAVEAGAFGAVGLNQQVSGAQVVHPVRSLDPVREVPDPFEPAVAVLIQQDVDAAVLTGHDWPAPVVEGHVDQGAEQLVGGRLLHLEAGSRLKSLLAAPGPGGRPGGLDRDVLEQDPHGRTGVELEGDDPRSRPLGIGQVADQVAVEYEADPAPLADDLVPVPSRQIGARVDDRLFFGAQFLPIVHHAALALVVEHAEVIGVGDVGLIPLDRVVGVLLAAELDSTVASNQLDRDPQAEIAEAPGGGEKTVALDLYLLRGADDHSVLHLPQSRIADPTGQVSSVEERNESLFVLGRAG